MGREVEGDVVIGCQDSRSSSRRTTTPSQQSFVRSPGVDLGSTPDPASEFELVKTTHATPNEAVVAYGDSGRVAPGDCSPGAPTDPLCAGFPHPVPQVIRSLRIRQVE